MSINEQINLNDNSIYLCGNTWIPIEKEKKSKYNTELDSDIRDRIRKVIERVTDRKLSATIKATIINFSVLEAALINVISKKEFFDLNNPEKLTVSRIGVSSEMLISLNEKINELIKLKNTTISEKEQKLVVLQSWTINKKHYDSETNQLKIFSITKQQADKINQDLKEKLGIPELFNKTIILKEAIKEAGRFIQKHLSSLEYSLLLELQISKKRSRQEPTRSTSLAPPPKQRRVIAEMPVTTPPSTVLKRLTSAEGQTHGLSTLVPTTAPHAFPLTPYPQQPAPVSSLELLGLRQPPQGLQLAPNPRPQAPVSSLELLGLRQPPQGLQLAPYPQQPAPGSSLELLSPTPPLPRFQPAPNLQLQAPVYSVGHVASAPPTPRFQPAPNSQL